MKPVKENIKKLPSWTFTIIVLCLILWLTLAPNPLGETDFPMFPGADKVVHFLMFGGLALTGLFDWSRTHGWRSIPAVWAWCIGLASAVIGIDIEFAQDGMGLGRTLELGDMAADTIGAFCAVIAWKILERTRPGKK